MSILDDGLAVLAKVAPTLATMIGGPLTGTAVSAIQAALGLEPGSKDDALKAVASASPEQLLALKVEDNRHAEAMEKLGIDREAMLAGDRDSARKREIEVKDWTPKALAVLLTLGFFGLLTLMMFHEVPTSGRDILNIMVGSLGTGWVTMLAYYFGSSNGADKAAVLLSKAGPIK